MKFEAEYIYSDLNGNPYEKVCRIEGKKGFPIFHWKNGKWEPGKAEKALPYLIGLWFREVRALFDVEGEKDSDYLVKLGFLATCNRGGAGNFQAEIAQYYKGRTVYI
ncbi:MAG TPA: hypothetical protein DD381_02120, partial [Lentisphaeria bacterium]|nr:hypothetical protein [Lentisphaeria bacterium]